MKRPKVAVERDKEKDMKELITAIVTLMLAVPVVAQEPAAQNGDANSECGCCSMMDGGMMSMMSEGRMEGMQEHMQEMQTLMEKIRQEENPERRRQLMEEHMESMEQGMGMMQMMYSQSQQADQDEAE